MFVWRTGRNSRSCGRLAFETTFRLLWMHTERAIPILPSNDLATAKTFYVDGLGFRVLN